MACGRTRRLCGCWACRAQRFEGAAAIGRAIGVAHHHGSDGFEGNVQFFGDDLAVRSVDGALAEIALAGADQNRVVRVNLDPRARAAWRSERGRGDRCVRVAPAFRQRETRHQGAAGFDETAAGECGAEH